MLEGGKVVKLKCKTCSKFENRITSIKGFSPNWFDCWHIISKKRQFAKTCEW